jgi:hypothetical protein
MGDEEIPLGEASPEEANLEPLPEAPFEASDPATDPTSDPSTGDFAGELPSLEAGAAPSEDTLSVDDLLSAATADDSSSPEAALLEAPLPNQPTFQLRLGALTEEQKNAFRKALEAEAVSIPASAWSVGPVISQLTEFQAIHLLQAARSLGLTASGTVQGPNAGPSEEDLALGELSGVPEANLTVVEGAPSVALPKGEKDVMLCSPSQLPHAAVAETFGLVVAHRSIARRMFREDEMREKLEKELRTVPSRGPAPLASSHLQQLLRDLLLDLRKAALAKGANSVLGVKIEAFPESSSSDPLLEQLRLVAFGTAAVVEKT